MPHQQKQNKKQSVNININTETKKKRKYVRRNQGKQSTSGRIGQPVYDPSLDSKPGGRGLYRGTVNPPIVVNQPENSATSLLAAILHNSLNQNQRQQILHHEAPQARFRTEEVTPHEVKPMKIDKPAEPPEHLVKEVTPTTIPLPPPPPPKGFFDSPIVKKEIKEEEVTPEAKKNQPTQADIKLMHHHQGLVQELIHTLKPQETNLTPSSIKKKKVKSEPVPLFGLDKFFAATKLQSTAKRALAPQELNSKYGKDMRENLKAYQDLLSLNARKPQPPERIQKAYDGIKFYDKHIIPLSNAGRPRKYNVPISKMDQVDE